VIAKDTVTRTRNDLLNLPLENFFFSVLPKKLKRGIAQTFLGPTDCHVQQIYFERLNLKGPYKRHASREQGAGTARVSG
jgi:hypothetical protein